MPLAGYPDWQRVQYAGGLQLFHSFTDPSGGLTFGPVNVQAWRTLILNCGVAGSTDQFEIRFVWSQTAVHPPSLQTTYVLIDGGYGGIVPIPVLGPYVTVTVIPRIGTDHTPMLFDLYTGSEVLTGFQVIDPSILLAQDTSSYLANGTKIILPGTVYAGNAVMYLRGSAQAFCIATLSFMQRPGPAFLEFAALQTVGQSGSLTAIVSLPAAPVQIEVFNGATAQNITASLMAMS